MHFLPPSSSTSSLVPTFIICSGNVIYKEVEKGGFEIIFLVGKTLAQREQSFDCISFIHFTYRIIELSEWGLLGTLSVIVIPVTWPFTNTCDKGGKFVTQIIPL